MRIAFLALGHMSLAVGIVGIVLPLVPTTPFVLLAAACYARGSDRFHDWLMSHPRFGPVAHAWRERRVIPLRAKVIATTVLLISLGSVLATRPLPLAMQIAIAVSGCGTLGYIWMRPSI